MKCFLWTDNSASKCLLSTKLMHQFSLHHTPSVSCFIVSIEWINTKIHIRVLLCDVGLKLDCNLVKSGSRFSYRPEKWGQRVCYQKSCNQQSPERAASLGVQTLAGTILTFPSIFLFNSLCVFVSLQKKKNNTFVMIFIPQDFELNTELKMRVIGFLEEVMHDPELLTQERKAAANIIRLVFCYLCFIAHPVINDTSVCQHPVA